MPDSESVSRNADEYSQKAALGDVTAARDRGNSIRAEGAELDEEEDGSEIHSFLANAVISRDVKNRVKLYVLCDQRVWDDKGTGHVACIASPEEEVGTFVVVRLEQSDKNILESRILMDTIYQKQQETLIVWSESDTCDLALSFQDKSGCEAIWEKICQVQGRDPEQHPDFTGSYDDLEDNDGLESSGQGYNGQRQTIGGTISLPPCELSQLPDIELVISNGFATAAAREKLANAIESQGYIPKLCDLFRMCEDLENLEALHSLFQITRNLFMLNRNTLLEILISDKYFKEVVGMLEYDPSESQPRKHREFLFQKSKFREVLPIRNESLRQKIHQTYRVQYIQDVCLPTPSLFEENLLSVINSHVFFSRVDIVALLKDDKELMKELFDQLKDPSTTPEKRKDLAMFLKEFCSFSASMQPTGPQGRDTFYKMLMDNDVLAAVEACITSQDLQIRTITAEVFVMIVEFNPQAARDYLLHQSRAHGDYKNENLLLNKLIEHMLIDRDPELTSGHGMAQVMRALLDPDNMIATQNMKSERHEFLTFFYRRSMDTLCRPLLMNTQNNKVKRDDYHHANQQAMIIDLLGFCFEHHGVHMRNYCINNKLLNRVLVLLMSKHHFLALSALRLFRRVVQVKDEFYSRYIVRDDVMRAVVECYRKNGHRYNLLNSALIELFEFIRMEDIKILIIYFVEKYGHLFDEISYVSTFRVLRHKYEQVQRYCQARDRELHKFDDSSTSDSSHSTEASLPTQWKIERQAESDEQWFNEEDSENVSSPNEWEMQRLGKENIGAGRVPSETSATQSTSLEVLPSSSTAGTPEEETSTDVSTTQKPFVGPLLPSSYKRKLEEGDAEEAFTLGSPIKANPPRIVIKMSSERRSLSASPPPEDLPSGEPIVSSTEVVTSKSTTTSTSTADVYVAKKPLVEYDESDSDEDDGSDSQSSGLDSIPSSSSSAGRSASNPSSTTSSPDDQDDVSSTSGDQTPQVVDEIKEDNEENDVETKRKRSLSPEVTRKRSFSFSDHVSTEHVTLESQDNVTAKRPRLRGEGEDSVEKASP